MTRTVPDLTPDLLHENIPRGSGGVKPPASGAPAPQPAPPQSAAPHPAAQEWTATPAPQPTSSEPPLGADTVPYLPRGVRLAHDRIRNLPILQGPERAMQLDPVGQAILSALDGRTLAQIIDALAAAYAAPRAQIDGDVTAFLQGLIDRRMVFVRLP